MLINTVTLSPIQQVLDKKGRYTKRGVELEAHRGVQVGLRL